MRRFLLGLALAAVGAWAPSARAGDLETAQGIANNLRSGGMKQYSVGVAYKDGIATLQGTVASEEQRQLALQIANQSAGVADVVDQLQVGAAEPQAAVRQTALTGNAAQQAAVQQALLQGRAPAQTASQARLKAMPAAVAPSSSIPGRPGAVRQAQYCGPGGYVGHGGHGLLGGGGMVGAPVGALAHGMYDQPHLPRHAWPAYAAYPNYGAVTYPKQYSPTAWPYIGPFYPYPQVPLGWRKVTLEWDDGWWMLDFKARRH